VIWGAGWKISIGVRAGAQLWRGPNFAGADFLCRPEMRVPGASFHESFPHFGHFVIGPSRPDLLTVQQNELLMPL